MPLSQGSELTLFPAQFWLLCCQKRDSQQVWTCKSPSVKVLCFMIPSSVGQSVPLLRWSLMPAEHWLDPWSSRWTAHRSQPRLAQRGVPLPPWVPFRADHGWLERLFVQWGNNHRVQKGELGNWECSDPSHLSAYNLKGSLEVSWQVPAEGNEVGCSHVGHPDKSGGVMCSSREEEMKMEFLYGHSLGGRAHSEASCRGNCLCALFLLPLKKKQTLAKILQDACCTFAFEINHYIRPQCHLSILSERQHNILLKWNNFHVFLLLSLPSYKMISTSFMVGLTPVLMFFKILQDSECFNL